MNLKRLGLATLAVFVVLSLVDGVFHGLMMADTYQAMQSVWRPDMAGKMWLMNVLTLFFAFMFVYIFTRGYEGKGLLEGVRYGILISLLTGVTGMFNQYVVYPIPLWLAWAWFGYIVVELILAGLVAAAIYRPADKKKK